MSGDDFDFERELKFVATEAVLSRDVDEAAQHVRQLATRIARGVNEFSANQRTIAENFRAWIAENHENLADDPERWQQIQERDRVLMKAYPAMPQLERWNRAANYVRTQYGTADQRAIEQIAQSRAGARYAAAAARGFETEAQEYEGSVDFDARSQEEDEVLSRVQAISQMKIGRMGNANTVDKKHFAEQELRRLQRGR